MIVQIIQIATCLIIAGAFISVIVLELFVHKGNKQLISQKNIEIEKLKEENQNLIYVQNGLNQELNEEQWRTKAITEYYDQEREKVSKLRKLIRELTNEFLLIESSHREVMTIINETDRDGLAITLDKETHCVLNEVLIQ